MTNAVLFQPTVAITFRTSLLIQFVRAVACLKGEQRVRRPWWAPSCLSIIFTKAAKRNRQSRVVSLKLEPWYTDMYLCMYNFCFKRTGDRKTTCLRIFPTLPFRSFRLFFLLVLLWRTSSSVQAFTIHSFVICFCPKLFLMNILKWSKEIQLCKSQRALFLLKNLPLHYFGANWMM